MKTNKYILSVLTVISITACHKADYMFFNDVARIQFEKPNTTHHIVNFYYEDRETVRRDTFYLTVNTIGDPMPYDRPVRFQQVAEYTMSIQTDVKGNVTDTVYTEVTNKAIPGVHYVSMEQPEILSHFVVKAGQVSARIPVILLRDPSLKQGEVRLCVALTATSHFASGEEDKLSQTIILSDMLGQPSNWSRVKYEFGTYSVRKHEFMIEVTQQRIDYDWIVKIGKDYSEVIMYRNRFANALHEFNQEPENIASGKAPLKDENNNDISF